MGNTNEITDLQRQLAEWRADLYNGAVSQDAGGRFYDMRGPGKVGDRLRNPIPDKSVEILERLDQLIRRDKSLERLVKNRVAFQDYSPNGRELAAFDTGVLSVIENIDADLASEYREAIEE